MRILHISDTHSKHRELPPLPNADIIIHSGDFTFAGSENEAYDFIKWFCDLPFQHKIFIAGNHDRFYIMPAALFRIVLGMDSDSVSLCPLVVH